MFSNARTSQILLALASQPGERLTVRQIMTVLQDRAFALLIVLLGLPNCLPMPPPIPLVCGLLLALVAIQITFGREAPWLPRQLMNRSVARTDVERAVGRAIPVFRRLERISRPRMTFLDTPLSMRLMGAVILILALGLLFAPPFVGQIPLGLAVCLVGLGLVERDGLVIIAGLVIGSIGLTLSLGFVYAIFAGLESLF
ncbi:exopolysaccharide biosynthesis protein [Microvirga lotononidis]|uniref:Putative ABC-type transport system, permease component n=1 Tax=Microvirga lotononidis TaxID=864069 RepID=I4YNV8_9HYPH|nr:exopolysaccharide biosynthesis protein [Microvirga lotononidis]EIM25650.1 putative ABC-type transport system, permease component [Microvirga lotononidis]WQO26466.1 exopolysaccharide biosynthesis protein [Microvirga lotononidis]